DNAVTRKILYRNALEQLLGKHEKEVGKQSEVWRPPVTDAVVAQCSTSSFPRKRIDVHPDVSIFKIPSTRAPTVQAPKSNAMSFQQVQNGQSTIVKPNPAPALPIANTTVVLPTGSSGTITDLKLFAAMNNTTPTTGLRMYRPIAPKPGCTTVVPSLLLSPTVTISPPVPRVAEGTMNSASIGNLPNGLPPMVTQPVVPSHMPPNQHQEQSPQSTLYAGGSKLVLPFGTTIKVTQSALNQQQPQMQPTGGIPVSTPNPQLHQAFVHAPVAPAQPSLGTISIPKPPQQSQKFLLNTRLPIAPSSAAGPNVPTNIPPLYVPPNKATIVTSLPKPGTMMPSVSVISRPNTGPASNDNIVKRRMSLGILKTSATATVEQQELRKPIKAFPIPVLSPFTSQKIVQQPQQPQQPQQQQQQQQQHSDLNAIAEHSKDRSLPLPSSTQNFVEQQCGQIANVNVSVQLENDPADAAITEDESSNDGSMLVMDLGESSTPEVKQGERNMLFGKGMERAAIIAQANGEHLVEVDNEQEPNDVEHFDDASNCSNLGSILTEKWAPYQQEAPKTPEKELSNLLPVAAGSTNTNVSPRLQKRSSSEHQQLQGSVSLSQKAAVPQMNLNRRRFSEFALVRAPPVGVTIPYERNEHYYIPLASTVRKLEPRSLLIKNDLSTKTTPAVVEKTDKEQSVQLLVAPEQPLQTAAHNVSLLCNETIDLPKQMEDRLNKRPFDPNCRLIPKPQIKPPSDDLNVLLQQLREFEGDGGKKQRLAKENSAERSTNSRSTSMSSDSNVPAGKVVSRTKQLSESSKKNARAGGGGKKSSPVAQITPSDSSTSMMDDGVPVYDTSSVADCLRWYDGIGYLSESSLHFEFDKFGIVQLLTDEAYDRHCQTNVYRDLQLPISERPASTTDPRTPTQNAYGSRDFYKCEVCKDRGRATDFVTPDFCSIKCVLANSNSALRDHIMNSTHALQNSWHVGPKRTDALVGSEQQKGLFGEPGQKPKNSRVKKKQTVKQIVKKASPSSVMTLTSSTSDDDSGSSLSLNSSTFLKRQAMRELMPNALDDSSPQRSADASAIGDGSEETEFNWNSYLKKINAESAPIHLFGPNPFPPASLGPDENKFRTGMKLEAIDPENNSLFCVCTVAEVRGYRLKLHFDGYPAEYDFWVNSNSIDIFPPGWCQQTNRVLQPPASYIGQPFSWQHYLQETNGLAPEDAMFTHLNHTSERNKFEVGMAIEADDLKKSGKVCVATVADKMGDRILIHFDGWDNRYDYWISIYSNYIHPVNWHRENNDKITAPPDWNKTFDWDRYIRYKFRANLGSNNRAEKPLFKTRPPIHFKPGQRLEVVDRKQEKLIRPAKVVATDGYEVKLCFEGWPREYAFWIEDDSPNLHPINWCARTKHPLEPPPNFLLSTGTFEGTCELKFCLSRGNSKFLQKKFHDRTSECPYKRSNWMSEDRKPLRLSHDQVQTHNINKPEPVDESQNVKMTQPSINTIDVKAARKNMANPALNVIKTSAARRRASVASVTPSPVPSKRIKEEADEAPNTATSTSTPTPPPSRDPSKERIVRLKEPEDTAISNNSAARPANTHESIRLARPVIEEYGPRLMHSYEIWQRHSRYLDECTEQTGVLRKNPLHWTTDEMARYIEQLPGCSEYASKIRHEEINGRSFLSFTQADLIDYLGVKIGPAIKLYNRIIRLRQLVTTKFIQL
uniref:SAM domain-containing protein n=1 Tax=Anopheles minimus TaxID=112268 RepID=A0A182WI29_9DIPT